MILYPKRPLIERIQRFLYRKPEIQEKKDLRLFLLYLEKYTNFTVHFEMNGGSLVNQMAIYHDGKTVISFRIPGQKEERHLILFGQQIWSQKIDNILKMGELKKQIEADSPSENRENTVSRLLREAYETQARTLVNDAIHTTIAGVARKMGVMPKTNSKATLSVRMAELKEQTNRLGELLNLLLEYSEMERSSLQPKVGDSQSKSSNILMEAEEDVVVLDLTSIIEDESFSEEKRQKAIDTLNEYNAQKTQKQKTIVEGEMDDKADIVIDTIRKNYLRE